MCQPCLFKPRSGDLFKCFKQVRAFFLINYPIFQNCGGVRRLRFLAKPQQRSGFHLTTWTDCQFRITQHTVCYDPA